MTSRTLLVLLIVAITVGSSMNYAITPGILAAASPSFSFGAAGDLGINGDSDQNLQSLASSGTSFFVALGDMDYDEAYTDSQGRSYNGATDSDFCRFVTDRVGSTYPFELIAGNHEQSGGSDGYIGNHASCLPDRLGGTPSNLDCSGLTGGQPPSCYAREYYIDYPSGEPLARIILLATNLPVDGRTWSYPGGDCDTATDPHTIWVCNSIRTAKQAGMWVIVGMHKVCIEATGDKSCEGQALMNMLIDEKVDLVIQAHAHTYQRSKQLICADPNSYIASCVVDDGSDNQYARGAGTVFVIQGIGGKGPRTRGTGSQPDFQYFQKIMGDDGCWPAGVSCPPNPTGFMKYTIGTDGILAETVLIVGQGFDSFAIGGSVPPPPPPPPPGGLPPPVTLTRQYWGTFYYPWYCDGNCPTDTWRHWKECTGATPCTHDPPSTWAAMFLPDDSSGVYDTSNLYSSKAPDVVDRHLTWMDRARLDFTVLAWFGQGSFTDEATAIMFSRANANASLNVKLAVDHELDFQGNPTVDQLVSDLNHIHDRYATSNAYFKISDGSRSYPVVFVAGRSETADYVNRWAQARKQMYDAGKPLFIVLKVFSGWETYANQADSWYQYAPSKGYEVKTGFSAFASPGYWKYPEKAIRDGQVDPYSPLLPRDPAVFAQRIATMNALTLSQAKFLLVQTFNEWHEGTQIEPGIPINHIETGFTRAEPSYGFTYIDIIRNRGIFNSRPALSVPGSQIVSEGSPISFAVTASDTDAPAQTITLSASDLPTGALFPTVVGIWSVTETFSWTPATGQAGDYTITFSAIDDGQPPSKDTKTIVISVRPPGSSPPTLNYIGPKTVDENTPLSFVVTASDPDGQAPVFFLGPSAPNGATITPAGLFGWTPTESQGPGSYLVTIVASDNEPQPAFDSETILMTVIEVNQAPTISVVTSFVVNEETLVTFAAAAADADVPINPLAFSLGPDAPPGSIISQSGTFSWVPTETQGPRTYSITVTVSDSVALASRTVSIRVDEINKPPLIVVPGAQTVGAGRPLTFKVSASDPDLPANSLVLEASGLPPGATFDATSGSFSWTPPNTQATGDFALTFTARDNGTPSLSDTETVVAHVTGTGGGDQPPSPSKCPICEIVPTQLQPVVWMLLAGGIVGLALSVAIIKSKARVHRGKNGVFVDSEPRSRVPTLSRIEEAFRQGKISRETYRRLRKRVGS